MFSKASGPDGPKTQALLTRPSSHRPGAQILKSRYKISQEGLGPLLDYFFSTLEFLKIARYYFLFALGALSEPSWTRF